MVSAQQDTAFVKTFVGIIAALVALTVFLIILATSLDVDEDPERLALERERMEQRLQPVAAVHLAGEPLPAAVAPAAPANDGPVDPAQIVASACAGCHGSGVMGAPKVGEKADWLPRFEQGIDNLVANAIKGIGAMPPRGGAANLSDEDVRAAVIHMLRQSKIEVAE